jgi:hypothetical protein
MRRSLVVPAGLVVAVFVAALLVPFIAWAAQTGPPSYQGTYAGAASGVSKKDGKKGRSAVTVWVQDLGATTRFTFRVDKIGFTVEAEGPEQWSGDTVTVPLTVKKTGIRANGVMTLTRHGDSWVLSGQGSGKVIRYEGSGQLAGSMTSTGVELPSLGRQIGDMFEGIFGGAPKPSAVPALTPEPQTSATPAATPTPAPAVGETVTVVEKASVFAPADAKPPIPDESKLIAIGLMVILLFLAIALA